MFMRVIHRLCLSEILKTRFWVPEEPLKFVLCLWTLVNNVSFLPIVSVAKVFLSLSLML